MSLPNSTQFRGCLLGQCLGDALGFLVEGQAPATCRAYVDNVLRAGESALANLASEPGRGGLPFGQYSDDSQLARELVESVLEEGRFHAQGFARRIAAIFTENRIVGRGRATEEAALRVARGVPWDQAGTPAPSAGNGSAMRAGPVGLLCHANPETLVKVAHDQGRITHQDPRCSAGAVAIAGAVSLALEPRPMDPAKFLAQLAAWTDPLDTSVAQTLHSLVGWLHMPPEEAGPIIARAGASPPRDRSDMGPSRNKMVRSGRRGARPARREEGEYCRVSNRRGTKRSGMDRRPERAGYFWTGPKGCSDQGISERASVSDGGDSHRWHGISPFVTPSVCWSLYAFLRSPEDYWETICTAVAVGGDVDTTAAMAGAVSGAHLGQEALPPSLLEHLTDLGTWGLQELETLMDAFHKLATP